MHSSALSENEEDTVFKPGGDSGNKAPPTGY